MKFDLESLVRENIKKLVPYSSARDEFKGKASVFLDANENCFGSPLDESYNRYPDPLQRELKIAIQSIKGVPAQNIFIGNGSDEVIDLSFRIFCDPQKDNVIICPPTYGMYEVCANINDVKIKKINLTDSFQLNVEGILKAIDENTKLIFICSPNNPTGNDMNRDDIKILLDNFNGIIIIDEAYINFSSQKTFIQELISYPNLIVMQTLSKAWGLAALRLGLCFASSAIIDLFNKVKPSYNINKASQRLALEALQNNRLINNWIIEIVEQRKFLVDTLSDFSFIKNIYQSDANFILIKVTDANELYQYLLFNKIIVRNRSKEVLCDNCIRITIGTPAENQLLISTLTNFNS